MMSVKDSTLSPAATCPSRGAVRWIQTMAARTFKWGSAPLGCPEVDCTIQRTSPGRWRAERCGVQRSAVRCSGTAVRRSGSRRCGARDGAGPAAAPAPTRRHVPGAAPDRGATGRVAGPSARARGGRVAGVTGPARPKGDRKGRLERGHGGGDTGRARGGDAPACQLTFMRSQRRQPTRVTVASETGFTGLRGC